MSNEEKAYRFGNQVFGDAARDQHAIHVIAHAYATAHAKSPELRDKLWLAVVKGWTNAAEAK